MTTTTYQRTDTGEYLDVREIRDQVDRLDGAASDGMFVPEVPVQTERKPHLPRREHHDVPARDYAQLIGQTTFTPDRGAVRDVRLYMRVGYEHLRQEAQDWRDVEFWAATVKHLPSVRVSADYWTNRDVLERSYERERDALARGLPVAAPEPALPVSPAGEAFLAQGPAPAEGFDTTEALNKMTSRVKTAVTGGEPEPEPPREPRWMRVLRVLGVGA